MIRLTPKLKSTGLKRTPLKRKPPKVSWLTKNPPKLRKTALKPMSKKMIKQRKAENELSLKLAELSGNRCEICGKTYNLHKHEIIKRSHQGDETDPLNCLLLCTGGCHNHVKFPISGTPLSIDEQLALANKLHENLY